jgi:hypothetical protein
VTLAAPPECGRFQHVALSHSEPLGELSAALTFSGGHFSTKPKISGHEIDGTATTGDRPRDPGVLPSLHSEYRKPAPNLPLTRRV